jgi:hypothetical protein
MALRTHRGLIHHSWRSEHRSRRNQRRVATGALIALLTFFFAGATPTVCAAAEEEDETAKVAKQLQNPVAALITAPFQSNFEWGGGPHSGGFKYTLNFQPVIPISLTDDWNLISRTIAPVVYQDDVVPRSAQGGMGDIVQSLFLSPAAPGPAGLIWGVGPVFLLPTTTTRFLGAEKFGGGPTGVLLRQDGGWTYGILANHLVSIGGTSRTSDVNATFLQPFVSYTTKTHTSFVLNTESTYDWENSKWTIPLIATVSQILKIRGQLLSLQLGPKLYVEGPTSAPDWGIRFATVFLFPLHK